MTNLAIDNLIYELGFIECEVFNEDIFMSVDKYIENNKSKKSREKIKKTGLVDFVDDTFTTLKEIEQVRWHINQLHSDPEKSIIFNFITKDEKTVKQKGFKIKDLTDKDMAEIIDMSRLDQLNVYMSQNTFLSTYKRTKEWVWRSGGIVVDVDFHKLEKYKYFTPEGIYEEIKRKYPEELQPSYAYSTGRGLCLVFLLEPIPLYKFDKNKGLWEKVFSALVDKYKEYGADDDAKGLSRVNRIPTSINQRNNKIARILYYEDIKDKPLKRYELLDLVNLLLEPEKIQRVEKNREKLNKRYTVKNIKKNSKKNIKPVKYLFNPYTLSISRKNDLEKLLELRHYDIEGLRNIFFHLYSLTAFDIYKDIQMVKEVVCEANNSLVQPLNSGEIDKIINSSKLSFKKKIEGQTGYYSYTNKGIIKLLDITDEEMENMETIISKEIKNNRLQQKRKEQRRNENGLTKREQQKDNNIKAVAELLNQGYKQKDICKKLKLAKSTVSEYVKEIKALKK